ncbi:hypothetical protein SSBR45G_32090 [Bradyrhizobium sp. SSBR45G]|uniref:hypothetical protein n=1 Tax=unclassified Bradyrhizobium TaxID=2631580 RepID=UPI0023429E56|nr:MULTISPECIES: hypothetical protein [unclassified Bradyrhizobium]GLH78300.1 hypothetical protein SSBR45G_32090 [Bradyrhizobium sp. SSBR45G]GLH85932.1 hypothetical protein SSBR45R_33920 [Bradyrhizobium sp. SSBR45R]
MGTNMSWAFVDGVSLQELYEVLDLEPSDQTPDYTDLGTSHVPLAGAMLKPGWCAIFAKYALVMDALLSATPPRLARLPAQSRCIACVVLEHAMVSYAGFWRGGEIVWEIRHDGGDHLEATGALPAEFSSLRDEAVARQQSSRSGSWGVDYLFNVPTDTAATVAGYPHRWVVQADLYSDLRTITPVNGHELDRLSTPPQWWQLTKSMRYR